MVTYIIKMKDEKQFKRFMKRLETKFPTLIWLEGQKPTRFNPFSDHFKVFILYSTENKKLTYSDVNGKDCSYKQVRTQKEFITLIGKDIEN